MNKFTLYGQAEIDGGRGMAVMLFHVECDIESLVVYSTLNLSFPCYFTYGTAFDS